MSNPRVANGLPTSAEERDELLHAITGASTVAIVVAVGRRIAFASPGLAAMTGYRHGELDGMDFATIVHPDHHGLMELRGSEWSTGSYATSGYRVKLVSKGGEARWAHLTVTAVHHKGAPAHLGTLVDITTLQRTEEALRESERSYRLIADHATDVIWTMSPSGRFTYVSPSVERLSGFKPEEMLSLTLDEALTPESAARVHAAMAEAHGAIARGDRSLTLRADLEQARKDGSTVWTEVTATALFDGDEFIGFLGINRDVSDRRQTHVQLRHAALHDALTGIANRTLLFDRIDHAVAVARREDDRFAVVYIDLDDFKPVNDRLGHLAGDEVLREVARRLGGCVRASDTVGRMGGDEFMVVVRSVANRDEADRVVAKVREAVERPYTIDRAVVSLRCSVGVALYPEDGDMGPDLVRMADQAMYHDKARLSPR
jgi:diguanylate cyclase (GGDEF)-like protein/PAS domain S-box-containing protein